MPTAVAVVVSTCVFCRVAVCGHREWTRLSLLCVASKDWWRANSSIWQRLFGKMPDAGSRSRHHGLRNLPSRCCREFQPEACSRACVNVCVFVCLCLCLSLCLCCVGFLECLVGVLVWVFVGFGVWGVWVCGCVCVCV